MRKGNEKWWFYFQNDDFLKFLLVLLLIFLFLWFWAVCGIVFFLSGLLSQTPPIHKPAREGSSVSFNHFYLLINIKIFNLQLAPETSNLHLQSQSMYIHDCYLIGFVHLWEFAFDSILVALIADFKSGDIDFWQTRCGFEPTGIRLTFLKILVPI